MRLARMGNRHTPFFRIVVADKRAPRDGKHIERVRLEPLCSSLLPCSLLPRLVQTHPINLSLYLPPLPLSQLGTYNPTPTADGQKHVTLNFDRAKFVAQCPCSLLLRPQHARPLILPIPSPRPLFTPQVLALCWRTAVRPRGHAPRHGVFCLASWLQCRSAAPKPCLAPQWSSLPPQCSTHTHTIYRPAFSRQRSPARGDRRLPQRRDTGQGHNLVVKMN